MNATCFVPFITDHKLHFVSALQQEVSTFVKQIPAILYFYFANIGYCLVIFQPKKCLFLSDHTVFFSNFIVLQLIRKFLLMAYKFTNDFDYDDDDEYSVLQ